MMEIRSETDYAKHHIKKLLGFFAAMREFKAHQESQGHKFIYIKLDDKNNQQDFIKNIQKVIEDENIEIFEMQEVDEYRLKTCFDKFISDLKIDSKIESSEHFFASKDELEMLFGKRKKYLLENFYRKMRVKFNILMDEQDKPIGGKWNFDSENRKAYPRDFKMPYFKAFNNDVSEIFQMIEKSKIEYIGNAGDPKNFEYPIDRSQSLGLLDFFVEFLLENFGKYQDAMSKEIIFGFHSRLSFSLNTKMLSPEEVIRKAENAYYNNRIEIAQVEGFIRQILGWREFMRSYYWLKMPEFKKTNFFEHGKQLPKFYWDTNTKMNCLKNCVQNSLDNAYAHHIQRLMITGNFALLAEVHPDQVDEWYLGIYIDAIEWVEITNTRGMSQWADGGGLASKPYISSANYINKMSDYCKNCFYNHNKKYNDTEVKNSCPFNSFYWDFINKHKDKLQSNPRMSMIYRVWDKFEEAEKEKILKQAKIYKEEINQL